ncbi:nitrate reductase [Selenomonas caprae]|uniref:Nitrate reductase n=1 Tax=Selenomonas caprae TaxID=2606905 RepID=A0A5D6WLZ5_9FIRM|nr:nitrate reductase [Selenomonas caprae]
MPCVPFSQKKEKGGIDLFESFIVSVLAGVTSYYICKWLDKRL